MKRMPAWLKWGVLTLLAASALIPVLDASGIGRFMLRIGIPYERVIQRGGQRVVEESPPLDSGSNYYTCNGPLLRGTELLEGSFYLEID